MKKLVIVEAKALKDIRGKELKYLVIGEGDDKVIVNVGDKTYDNVRRLIAYEEWKAEQNNVSRETEPITKIQILPEEGKKK